jgi:hypothetical protein
MIHLEMSLPRECVRKVGTVQDNHNSVVNVRCNSILRIQLLKATPVLQYEIVPHRRTGITGSTLLGTPSTGVQLTTATRCIMYCSIIHVLMQVCTTLTVTIQ